MRWHHPQRGMIAPNDFIPLAEETGLIVEWALGRSIRPASRPRVGRMASRLRSTSRRCNSNAAISTG